VWHFASQAQVCISLGLEICPSAGEVARSGELATTWSVIAKTPGNDSRPVPEDSITLCYKVSGPFRAPFALPSQWIQGRKVEMTVPCHVRPNVRVFIAVR